MPTVTTNKSSAAGILWLSFLVLYLTPWVTSAPGTSNWLASAIGTTLFLVIYIHSFRCKSAWLGVHVGLTALIGFALARYGGVWNVFIVCASAIAARISPRGRAVAVIVGLQIALCLFGLATNEPPVAWVSGVYFSILAAGTTVLLSDLADTNSRLQEAQAELQLLTAVAERERIARDLHDLLGHTLTAIALKSNLAARLFERDPARAASEIAEVADAARGALSEVRTAVSGISARFLADEIPRAERVLTTANLEVEIDAPASSLEARDKEHMLAMVLREATTNIIRHANARRCRIATECTADHRFSLIVQDDGRGGVIEGFGIAGMKRRLGAIGGSLSIESDHNGTRVVATVWDART